jgi:dipeptidyl aminopeptidase/acylaminoacyl peptidase
MYFTRLRFGTKENQRMNQPTVSTSHRPFLLLLLLAGGLVLDPTGPIVRASWVEQAPPQRLWRRSGKVYKGEITPHWFADNSRFWYRNDLAGGKKEFVLVDAGKGTRGPAFDHQKLAAALSKAAAAGFAADRLPFDAIEFSADAKTVRFRVGATTWQCDLASYACAKSKDELHPPSSSRAEPGPRRRRSPRFQGQRRPDGAPVQSPDGKWTAFVKEHNVWLRSRAEATEVQLSKDGNEGLTYGRLSWAPDGQTLVAFRIAPGDNKLVHLIESSPRGGGRARLHSRPYVLPGDKLPAYELNLFSLAEKKQLKPAVDRIDFGWPMLRWKTDGRHFTYSKIDRGHQRFRLIEVDSHTGQARTLIDEKSKTFIWTAHTEMRGGSLRFLDKSDEIIYASEQDGWRHLYLIDGKTGQRKSQITKGAWVVRGIDRIDEDKRQIWFRASGKDPGQDPYLIHYYRINFDGTGLVALTPGNGDHRIRFSPDGKYLIDRYARVELPPVHELRRTSDGTLVCELEKADISPLQASGWAAPEVFVAKGRDGKTDIWGIITRPANFDPQKKYPVLEYIYAGPHGSFVPKTFMPFRRFGALNDLGFVVVQMDGMGTANRSKAFHDVCWKNLKDAGFPDRILWHQAVAKKYSWYDLSHVGIYGTSAGGQSALAALLFHGDFYKAAVAACGCHDNRMDKASWNEQWMGYPVGPQYAASSNVDNAYRLRGKLLLIVGELDTNVPPESTMRVVDALIKAGKDFDLLVLPGMNHTNGGAYGNRRLQDFFVRHLQGREPPDRNAGRRPVEASSTRQAGRNGLPAVTTPPEAFFDKFRERDRPTARAFYKKYLSIQGLPVAAAGVVADEALQQTSYLVTHLLAGRPDILQAMIQHGTRLIVIGKDQVYTDMPEYRHSRNPTFLNERVRGTGGFHVTSFGEENLLNLPLDRYDDESIAVHEFCHTIDAALGTIDPTWRKRLRETYRSAMSKGLWRNAYTASNPAEYWAEICQSYFDCNRMNNWNHNSAGTRERLKLYDPAGYDLVRTTFRLTPATDWRYRPLRRQPSVIPPPARFKVAPYYTKFTCAREFAVLGSKHVRDEALLKANDTIRKMFAYRHDILKAMIADGARLVILGRTEKLSDLPEFQDAKSQTAFDEARYREYDPRLKLMVVPEENVLGLHGEPFAGKSMVVHVFAKGLYRVTGLRPAIPDFEHRRDLQQYELRVKRMDIEFDRKLQKIYQKALEKSLWRGTPAARDRVEYWSAGVEAYFDASGPAEPPRGAERPITTREALRAYDPDLFVLVEETMAYKGHVDWHFKKMRTTPKDGRPAQLKLLGEFSNR